MFIVLEIQTNADGVVGIIPTTKETENEARSEFYRVLSYAAISDVPIHTALLINSEGGIYSSECFKHEVPELVEE